MSGLQLIVRPLAVACTAIHGVFDMTEQFRSTHLDANGHTVAEKYLKLSTDVAYIKHIRWFGPPNGTAISCKFGAEVNQWDAENALIVQVSCQTVKHVASRLAKDSGACLPRSPL